MKNHESISSDLTPMSDTELGAVNGGSMSVSLSQLVTIVREGFKLLA